MANQDQEKTVETIKIKQPNSRHCFICGIENPCGLKMSFYEVEPGHAVAEYTVSERYQSYPGIVHGGIVAAMLDETLGRAAMVGDHNHLMVTAKVEVRYRKPVPVGIPLQIHGRLGRQRGKLIFASAELRLPDGTLAAEAEGLLADLPDQIADQEQLEKLGWKVYPD